MTQADQRDPRYWKTMDQDEYERLVEPHQGKLRALWQRKQDFERAERDLTQTVESYRIAGVPLGLMLCQLGWSERTWFRRMKKLNEW